MIDETPLEDRMKVNLNETTEMGEVVKEFSEDRPGSSNLTSDEHKLLWRAEGIYQKMSPSAVILLHKYRDGKRSVFGWNTSQKVAAITGIQQNRTGFGERFANLFRPQQ